MGAWIETLMLLLLMTLLLVASYMGAWIETMSAWAMARNYESHPTWVRGLKLLLVD